MPKKKPRPRPLSGAGQGKGPRARVFWGPVRPVTNSMYDRIRGSDAVTVTILLLSVGATGNDSHGCLLRMRVSFSCTNRWGVLSLQIVRNWLACLGWLVRGTISSDSKMGGLSCLIELSQ